MKARLFLYITIFILIFSFLFYGCKKEEPTQIQETVEETTQEQSEEIIQEVTETIQEPEYHPECGISFEYENFFEISQRGLDLGYPYFSFTFADEWEVEEIPEDPFGYLVRFRSPDYIDINTETVSNWDQPLMDERIYILNEEHQDITPSQFIEELWRPVFGLPELEILEFNNIDEKIFFIIWQEPEGNTFWEHFRFSDIDGKVFLHIVSAIDYCYDPWSDILINSAIDERMVIEEETIAEYIEENIEEFVEEETEEEPQAIKPTIALSVIEGPVQADGLCYYRIKADTGGTPTSSITFNRDDSDGAWGTDIVQVNLSSPSDSFTITASAANIAGSATDSIVLNWGCEIPEEETIEVVEEEIQDKPKEEPSEEEPPVEESKFCPVIDSFTAEIIDGKAYMSATAHDLDGGEILYKFSATSGGDSGWQTDNTYVTSIDTTWSYINCEVYVKDNPFCGVTPIDQIHIPLE